MQAAEAFDLTGKVVWVTGSSRGIGRAISGHLSSHGAVVAVHGRDRDRLSDVLAELPNEGYAVTCDVRDLQSVTAAVAAVEASLGGLDAVVCNVGGAAAASLADMDPALWQKMLDLNLTGSYNVARASYPLLRRSNGSVVLVSATAASNPAPQFGAYGAAKAGVEHLTRSLAAEWGPEVRVNCVSPGLIVTAGSMKALFGGSEERLRRAGSVAAVGRAGRPDDVAWAVHYLISPAAAYVSGAVLVVDGGPTEGVAQRVSRATE